MSYEKADANEKMTRVENIRDQHLPPASVSRSWASGDTKQKEITAFITTVKDELLALPAF